MILKKNEFPKNCLEYQFPRIQTIYHSNRRITKRKSDTRLNTYIYSLFLVVSQAIRIYIPALCENIFIATNIAFSIFVILNIYTLKDEKRWLLNPLFLASIGMFLFAYGATILYIYAEGKPISDYIDVVHPFDYLNNGMIYASIGFITMWNSYHSNIVRRNAYVFFYMITIQKKVLRKDLSPRWVLVCSIFFLSIVFKLFIISLGKYGVISTILPSNPEIPFLQIIVTLSSLSSVILIFLNLYFFKTGKKKSLFIVFFLIDFFFSIISGFKGAIVMSILVILISYYITHGKISPKYILMAIISIGFAYAVIEPYRGYVQKDIDFDKNSVSGITAGFTKSYMVSNDNAKERESDKFAILKRFNFLPELTKFQEYKTVSGLKNDDPDFLYLTLIAPLQIFIPRFLWKDKPKSDLGVWWVTQKVFGRNYNSSSAFGPLGFLYLTGGFFAIVIGFFIIGFFLQLVNIFLISKYWGGIFIVLALLSKVTMLEAGFNFYIIGFVQTLILSIIFQYIILNKNSKLKRR